jgi:hypothetical protein
MHAEDEGPRPALTDDDGVVVGNKDDAQSLSASAFFPPLIVTSP